MAPKADPIQNSYDVLTNTAPRIVVAPSYTDPATGAVYVHSDLAQALAPWAIEAHVAPTDRTECFGDVESWVSYVKTYSRFDQLLLTWSEGGLKAVLDYVQKETQSPGRHKWVARQPFEKSIQFKGWAGLANGTARSQKALIEALEDYGEDIQEPDAATLVGILRTLRATANATADTELRPDGTTSVSYTKNQTVQAGKVDLPPEIVIAIPVLKGHPVLYKIRVRVRVSVDDSAHLAFRLSMPGAERALEDVYADRVAAATALLDDSETYPLLRSTVG